MLYLLLIFLSTEPYSAAERGFVMVEVLDAQGHPLRGVEIRVEGIGGSGLTGDDGGFSAHGRDNDGRMIDIKLNGG